MLQAIDGIRSERMLIEQLDTTCCSADLSGSIPMPRTGAPLRLASPEQAPGQRRKSQEIGPKGQTQLPIRAVFPWLSQTKTVCRGSDWRLFQQAPTGVFLDSASQPAAETEGGGDPQEGKRAWDAMVSWIAVRGWIEPPGPWLGAWARSQTLFIIAVHFIARAIHKGSVKLAKFCCWIASSPGSRGGGRRRDQKLPTVVIAMEASWGGEDGAVGRHRDIATVWKDATRSFFVASLG